MLISLKECTTDDDGLALVCVPELVEGRVSCEEDVRRGELCAHARRTLSRSKVGLDDGGRVHVRQLLEGVHGDHNVADERLDIHTPHHQPVMNNTHTQARTYITDATKKGW